MSCEAASIKEGLDETCPASYRPAAATATPSILGPPKAGGGVARNLPAAHESTRRHARRSFALLRSSRAAWLHPTGGGVAQCCLFRGQSSDHQARRGNRHRAVRAVAYRGAADRGG